MPGYGLWLKNEEIAILVSVTPQNMIIRMPNWIGDLVMATPVLTDLKAAFPHCSITAMCRAPLAQLLEKDQAIDELFSFTKRGNQFLRRERRDCVAKIRQGKFDVALLLTNSFSSAWLFWLGKVPCRIGYKDHFRTHLLTNPIEPPLEKMHQVDRYKKLIEPFGITRSKTIPRLFLAESEIDLINKILYQRGYRKNEPLIGINPGAAYGSAKCWPPEKFRELSLRLAKKGWILFFGDDTTAPLVKEICLDMPSNVINLAGQTTLRELACFIHECDLLISNDSGPMHIGQALGVELIAIFGSTDEEITGPYLQPQSVLRKKVYCAPCFKRECPIHFPCMEEIQVEEVFQKAVEKLRV